MTNLRKVCKMLNVKHKRMKFEDRNKQIQFENDRQQIEKQKFQKVFYSHLLYGKNSRWFMDDEWYKSYGNVQDEDFKAGELDLYSPSMIYMLIQCKNGLFVRRSKRIADLPKVKYNETKIFGNM